MYRKIIFCILFVSIISLSMSVTPFTATQAQAKKMTIKAISAWGKNYYGTTKEFLPFIERVNKVVESQYPGEFEIKYIGGPETIPSMDQPGALSDGTFDMYYGTAAYYAGIAPAANCTKLSQLTRQEEKDVGVDAILDEIHRKKLNSTYLGTLSGPMPFQLYTIEKVTTVDQIRNLKIRTSPMYVDFLRALDASPIATKPGDVYQALERGVVDGLMWPLYSIRPYGWQEVAKYVVGPGFYKACAHVLVNAKKWDQIPKHIQAVIIEVFGLETTAIDARTRQIIKKEYELLEEAGMKVIKFSSSDNKRYLDMAYEAGWKGQLKMETVYTSKLRKLLTK